MQYNFISGLPRSGSTLLASILRQNPKFTASIMTPVGRVVTDLLMSMSGQNEAHMFLTEQHKRQMLRGIFSAYYEYDDLETNVAFDNNRRWCANMSLLADLYPESKVICCVRSPAAIVDSFERLFQKNPLDMSEIYGARSNLTVYNRVEELMKSVGVVGFALNAFRSAYYGPFKDKLLIINYSDLCRSPHRIMKDLHLSLGFSEFNYDFEHIYPIPGTEIFDKELGTPGLHNLKPSVVYEERATVLPPDIFQNLPKPFWNVKKEATHSG